MTAQGATARPWHKGNGAVQEHLMLFGPDSRLVASCIIGARSGPENMHNARLIVEAVNNHDRLQRMAEAGAELADASNDLKEWAGRSTLPLQRVKRWFDAIAAYEEASK